MSSLVQPLLTAHGPNDFRLTQSQARCPRSEGPQLDGVSTRPRKGRPGRGCVPKEGGLAGNPGKEPLPGQPGKGADCWSQGSWAPRRAEKCVARKNGCSGHPWTNSEVSCTCSLLDKLFSGSPDVLLTREIGVFPCCVDLHGSGHFLPAPTRRSQLLLN